MCTRACTCLTSFTRISDDKIKKTWQINIFTRYRCFFFFFFFFCFFLEVLQRVCPEKLLTANLTEAAKNLSYCGYDNFTTASQEYWTWVINFKLFFIFIEHKDLIRIGRLCCANFFTSKRSKSCHFGEVETLSSDTRRVGQSARATEYTECISAEG